MTKVFNSFCVEPIYYVIVLWKIVFEFLYWYLLQHHLFGVFCWLNSRNSLLCSHNHWHVLLNLLIQIPIRFVNSYILSLSFFKPCDILRHFHVRHISQLLHITSIEETQTPDFHKRYRYIVILSVVVILKEPIEESIGSLVYKIIQQVVLNSV